VDEALRNNLLVRQAQLGQQDLAISGKQLRQQRIPSLNLGTNLGFSIGRVVNPATNDFEFENSFYQSLSVQSGVMLFDGLRISQSVRQNKMLYDAAGADIRQAENDLALSVALAYLNVLLAYENLDIAMARVKLSTDQLADAEKLIAAGSRPENARYDIEAQIALDEQSLVTAQNNIDINLLALKQQMMLEPSYPLVIDRPRVDVSTLEALETQTLDAIYTAALSSQPQVEAAELREQSGQVGIKVAQSQLYPSLSLGFNAGTNWSTLFEQPTNFILDRVQQPGVFINDEAVKFEAERILPTNYAQVPYLDQLDANTGYGAGLTLQVPVFNQYANRGNIERAKLEATRAQLNTEQTKQTLRTDISNALTSAKASRKALDAAGATANAARLALRDATQRFELGVIGNFEYLSARNRADAAESNLLIARYDYYFRIKVLEFYMGRVIQID
jgi:outer membrane protein